MRLLVICALLAVVSCRASDPSFRTRSGERLSDLDPLPFRVAIARLDGKLLPGIREPDQKESLWFAMTATHVQDCLVALLDRKLPTKRVAEPQFRLTGLRTFNEARGVASSELDESVLLARAMNADLLIVPRLNEKPLFDYRRINGRWATSMAVYITWIGGFFVQDLEYRAVLSFEFDIVNPHDGTTITTFTAASRTIDADLWERMDYRFLAVQTLWSIFLPGFAVPDNHATASKTMSARTLSRLAGQLTGFLKEDYIRQARKLTGTLTRIEPRNESLLAARPFVFTANVVAEEPITYVAIFVNDEEELRCEWRPPEDVDQVSPGDKRLLNAQEQSTTGIYVMPIRLDELQCPPEGMTVRVEFAVNGRYASQTIVYSPERTDP